MKWAWIVGAVISAVTVAFVAKGGRSMAQTAPMDVGSPPPPPPKEWSDADFRTLAEVSNRLRMNPADLLLVLASESGMNPRAANRDHDGYPIAVGLNQLTAASNPATGLTEAQRLDLLNVGVSSQLHIVERFFDALAWTKAGKHYPHAGAIYAVNFVPARVLARGVELDTVLVDTADGSMYSQNKLFDRGNKGRITVRDLVEQLRTVANRPAYKGALAALRKAMGDATLSPTLPT